MALSNELVLQWYYDEGPLACMEKIFDRFPEAQRNDTEKRSLRQRIACLVKDMKRPRANKADLLKQDFKGKPISAAAHGIYNCIFNTNKHENFIVPPSSSVPESFFSGSAVQSPVASASNLVNNNDPKELSMNGLALKDLRPRRGKQVRPH